MLFQSKQRCYFEYDQQGANFTQELPRNAHYLLFDGAQPSTNRTWTSIFLFLLNTSLILLAGAKSGLI